MEKIQTYVIFMKFFSLIFEKLIGISALFRTFAPQN